MAFLDIYRHETDDSFSWFASANSLKMARAIIKSSASTPTEEYLVCDPLTKEKIILRPNGCWSPYKEPDTVSHGEPGLLFGLRSTRHFT
jgi:hypothetical protein